MITDPHFGAQTGPLVLGASGRIGTGFQRLAAAGLWPGPHPVWQVRGNPDATADQVVWDILATGPPDFGAVRGIIALAGVVRGDLGLNTALALAAIDLARSTGTGPVLICSSAAVYGRASEPVDEDAPCAPISAYGLAKLDMEQAVVQRLRDLGPDAPACCILRIGNVAGPDMLLQAAQRGPVTLDQFAGGQGPVRSYVGIQTLAQTMVQLIDLGSQRGGLPPVLNIAATQPVQMADLLTAAQVGWTWQPAVPSAIPSVILDARRLAALVPLAPNASDPAELIRQARLTGWAAA